VAASSFDVLLDAGTHVIVVSAPGAADTVVTKSFAAGTTVSLTLGPDTTKAPVAPKPASTGSGARRAGAAVAFALGGAGAIAGGVFGGLAIKKRSELDGVCMPKDQCPATAQGTIDAMNTFATVSTVGVVTAGVGVGVGVVLLVTGREPASSTPGPTATPILGPGFVGVRGTF
jgi:hypothetical protein